MMIKILNKANNIEIAIITVVINEISNKKKIDQNSKLSNWFISSRTNKEIKLLSSKSIWKIYSDF